MILLANFIFAVAVVVKSILGILLFLVIGRAIISWVSPDPYNPIVRFLTSSTEPFIRPIRKIIPPIGGNLDLSPLVLLLIIYFLQAFLVTTLFDYSVVLKQGIQIH